MNEEPQEISDLIKFRGNDASRHPVLSRIKHSAAMGTDEADRLHKVAGY